MRVSTNTSTETPAKAEGQTEDGLHKVRTTNQPDVEIVVDDRELADLRAFGFLTDEKKGR